VTAQDPDKIAANIGSRIAELRIKHGWTQEQFSVRLRASVQWVSQIEAGANLTVHSLVKVANALGVVIVDLLALPSKSTVRRRGRPRKRPPTDKAQPE
jgi:transcriptional regulator with XRE-family HTH domain